MCIYIICHGQADCDGLIFQINDHGIFLGSDEKNEIVLRVAGVSDRHLRLFSHDRDLMLEDVGSLNGTFLNGRRIEGKIGVTAGDCIQAGTMQIRFEKNSSGPNDISYQVFLEKPTASVFLEAGEPPAEGNPDVFVSEEVGECDTAMTVMADANIKELIRAGKLEELQRIGEPDSPADTSVSSRAVLTEGRVIGKYRIIRKIGKGGMGVIYLAKHETLNAYRALKVLPHERGGENDHFFERFLREARMASEIHHPNVVAVMDVETDMDYDVSYIVMEYIDGGSLRRILKSQKTLTEEQAAAIVQGVAQALSVAAEHKIVHRDIKPDNIMFTRRGEVKLADLGIAKNDNDDVNLTKTNIMIGTPAYLSPEQVENPKAVDIRSDIYSLGATFYEMLTGQHPYVGSTTYDIIHKLFTDPVPDPRDKNPDISAPTAKIVMRMLDKEPGRRYQTPAELLAVLAEEAPPYTSADVQILIKSAISGTAPENLSSTLLTSSVIRKKFRRQKKRIWHSRFFPLFIGAGVIAGIGISVFFRYRETLRVAPVSVARGLPVLADFSDAASTPLPSGTASKPKLFALHIKTEPDTEIQLISSAGAMTTYMTSSAGTIHINELAPGRYTVRAKCRGRKEYDSSISVEQDRELEIRLQPDGRSATFATLPGAVLFLEGESGVKESISVPVSGAVTFPVLPLDSYTVRIVRDGYKTEERTFVLKGDLTMQIPLAELQASLQIATVPAAKIELMRDGVVRYAQKADHNGILSLPKFARGDYILKISRENFQSRECRITLHEDLNLDLPLEPVVKELTIHASPHASIRLQQGNVIVKETQVNADGKLVLPSLPTGKYEIFFSKDGFQSTSQTILLADDLSVQVAMKQLPSGREKPLQAQSTEVKAPQYGSLSVRVDASGELLAYVMKNGLEMRIDDGAWEKVEQFPCEKELPDGKIRMRIRGKGFQPLPAEPVTIRSGERADVVFMLLPVLSKVVFSSNLPHAKFFFQNTAYSEGASATIEPFREYSVTVKADGFEDRESSFSSEVPGATVQNRVIFEPKKVPFSEEFAQGMALLNNENYEEALKLLTIAGNGGHPDAARQVAIIYEKGLGMWFSQKNLALEWYRKAAVNGNASCAFLVAEAIREGNMDAPEKEMLSFYLQAANGKHACAAYRVAQFYERGGRSFPADEQKVIEFLTLSADLQYPEAMFELGLRYENGKGVPVSSENAIKWYRRAAKSGSEKAEKRLAVLANMKQ